MSDMPLMVEVMTHSELQDECERLWADLAAANAKLAVLQAPQDVAGLTFAWTATEPQSNFPSYINAAYADDGSLRVAIRGKAHLDDEGEGPGFSAVVVLPSRVASDFFYALGALSIESIAANAKLAALQAPQDVARLVKELTDKKTLLANGHDMSFYRYREDEVRPKAADALLSQAAQLAEKEEHLSQTLDQLQRHMNWDSAEWDRQLLALKRQLTEKEAECEMKLPCGVKLDSGTHIGKGCALSTLIVALKARAKYKADAARQP